MGEEENKASANNDDKTTADSAEAKPGIADRMRDMGILDRDKRSAESAPARPWKLYITGAVIVAGIGLWYWTSGASLNETSIQPMAHMPPPGARGPYGWPAPPPHFQARPGNQPDFRQPPSRAWNGPPPAYYYGRGYNPSNSQPNSNLNNQGAARQWPPQRRQYGPGFAPGFAQRPPYYGPSPANNAESSSTEESGNNAVNQARPAPGWMRPLARPQRPQWAGPQGPNYQRPQRSSQPRFGPPQQHWNNTPPGWPREAWRATRPEEVQKQQQEEAPATTSAQPLRQWPEPPRRRWGPGYNNQYNPYGGYQPSSYQSSNTKDNPWSQ